MAISPELRAIIDGVPADFARPDATVADVRAVFDTIHSQPYSDELVIREVSVGDAGYAHYHHRGEHSPWIVLHCHGGAFVSSPVAEYHFYAELIIDQLHCQVVMPDYRIAPEYPYPAAHHDCFQTYKALLEEGVDPEHIILMGESCGGCLAAGLMLRARDEGLPQPRCFISLTGWFDLSVSGPEVPGKDPFLTPEWVRNRGRDYLAGAMPLDDPRVSPAYADLTGLPPMYIQVPEYDTVREGAFMLIEKARLDGVDVNSELLPEMIQGIQGLTNAGVPEAHTAWDKIREYLAAQGVDMRTLNPGS